jgi:hypothetical protein
MSPQYDTWNRIQQIIYPDDPPGQPDGEVLTYFYDYGGLVTRVHGDDDQLEQNYATNAPSGNVQSHSTRTPMRRASSPRRA